jgi:tRNA1(Val) A37 N6-methylase TrmN6
MQKQENKPDLNLIYKKYQENYLSKKNEILKFNEDEYQTQFLNDIFVNILGYTLKTQSPKNFNLEQETKNITDSKKADATILKNNKVVAVIELKKSSVKMDSITEQAFIYLNNHENCKYAITSNFNYLRLFIEKSNEFIEFDLFNMDFDRFTEFYNLLSLNSIFDDFPFKEKQRKKYQNMVELEKKFYAEYSQVRKDIFKNIISFEQNLKTPKDIILEKSQKLLDRLIFIFFAESRGLIPFSAKKIIEQWKINNWEEKNLYHIIKLVFKKINSGSKIPEVFNYNGGLFADDDFFDNLHISDNVLQNALHLGFYNFNSEIDVNILGHIFENSLDDLIKIKENLFGDEFDIDKSIRKKDGIFYTPKYIVDYIIENSLGKLCRENREKLSDSEYFEFLKNLKILDPAVGSGAFLNGAFDFLSNEYKTVIDKLNKQATSLFDFHDYDLTILENNLFGVDLNREAVEITKLSLWLKTAKRNRQLTKLNNNIRQGNSLTTFDWSKEFDFKFDVIIGNPPYVRIQGLKDNEKTETEKLESQFKSATGNYDIYVLFMEKSLQLINSNGVVSFILPHKFLISEFGKGIRNVLFEQKALNSIVHFGSEIVFEEASTYTCIVKLSLNNESVNFAHVSPKIIEKDKKKKLDFDSIDYESLSGDKWILQNSKIMNILKKIESQKLKAKDIFRRIFTGLQTSGDKIYLLENVENGYFSQSLNKTVQIEKGLIKPILKGEDISRYENLQNRYFVIFPYLIEDGKAKPMTENYIAENFPNGYKYLKENEKELRGRERGKMDKDGWFLYIYPKSLTEFEQEKIVTSYLGNYPNMTFEKGKFYHNTKGFGLVKKQEIDLNYEYLLAILNSAVFWFFIKNTSTEFRGGYFTFTNKQISPFGIPEITEIKKTDLDKKAEKIMQLKREFAKVKTEFLDEIRNEYQIKKINKNLDNFENLESIEEFMLEIQKLTKIKFKTAKEKKDFKNYWNSLFEEESKKLRDLKIKIAKSEKEIDKIVYKLYDLNRDEVQIIENS